MKSKKIDEARIRKGKKEKILKDIEKKVGKWGSDRIRGDCPGAHTGRHRVDLKWTGCGPESVQLYPVRNNFANQD